MSLKKKPKKIHFKITIYITILLMSSLLFVSVLIYSLLSQNMRSSDRQLLMRMGDEYARLYKLNKKSFEQVKIPEDLVLVIQSSQGLVSYQQAPKYIDHDFEDEAEIQEVMRKTRDLELKEGMKTIILKSGEEGRNIFDRMQETLFDFFYDLEWSSIYPMFDNDLFEVKTLKMDENHWLKIGKSCEDREEYLSQIRVIGLLVIIPFLILGFVLSFIISKKILRPFRNLSETIEYIKAGDRSARAPLSGSEDELDHLSLQFNGLIDRNDKLVDGLKNTIDSVAHDLRTPISRFRIAAEKSLASNGDKYSYKDALIDGVESSESILSLLNTIMNITEVESGVIHLNKEEVKINNLITSLIDVYQYSADEKKQKIELYSSEEITAMIDGVRISQALANLIDNAIKYSPEKSEISITIRKNMDNLIIDVLDHGPGIEQEDLPFIWDRLYRGDKSRSTSGAGLGLSLCKAIVEAHKGELDVKNNPDFGATFSLRLPLCNV